jgi:hypothetical protein
VIFLEKLGYFQAYFFRMRYDGLMGNFIRHFPFNISFSLTCRQL